MNGPRDAHHHSALDCAVALLAAAILSASTSAARAARPQDLPTLTADIGKVVVLGGVTAGVADPLAEKQIVVRDATGQPAVNVTVVLDFTACTGADIRLCSNQPDPNIRVNCATHRVAALTDFNGVARFHIVGNAVNPGGGAFDSPAPGFGAGGALVYTDGMLQGSLVVAALDQDGRSGLNVEDIALFLNDRFSVDPADPATLRGRSDYDGNQTIDVVDLALLLRARFAGGSLTSCTASCP